MEDLFTPAELERLHAHMVAHEWNQLGHVITAAALRGWSPQELERYMNVRETFVADLILRAVASRSTSFSLADWRFLAGAIRRSAEAWRTE
jgi:hypothetical protein